MDEKVWKHLWMQINKIQIELNNLRTLVENIEPDKKCKDILNDEDIEYLEDSNTLVI